MVKLTEVQKSAKFFSHGLHMCMYQIHRFFKTFMRVHLYFFIHSYIPNQYQIIAIRQICKGERKISAAKFATPINCR